MSLINKMLQDLDRRHAMAAPEVAPPPRQVHAVEGSRRIEWFWRIVAALMAVMICWVAWVAWQLHPRTLATELAYQANDEARARASAAKVPVVAQAAASIPSVEQPKPPVVPPMLAAEPAKPPPVFPKPPAEPVKVPEVLAKPGAEPVKPHAVLPKPGAEPVKPHAVLPKPAAESVKPPEVSINPVAELPKPAVSPKVPAVLPKPPAAPPPKPASVVAKPSPPSESLKLALAIETPISERARAPVTRPKDPDGAGKIKSAAESAIVPASKAQVKASPAEDKKAVAELAREAAPKPVLPAPPSAAARVEKRERTRSSAERAEAEFRRAVGLLNQGRTSEAEEGLAAALEKDPSHEAARQALVALQIERRQLDNARRLLQEGLAINPAQTAFAIALARIFVERRDYHAALATLQGAGGTTGNNADFEAMRGTVLQRMGRHQEAAEAYQSALRAQASSPHAWIGLGISLEALAQRAEAVDAFRRSLAAGPLSTELRNFAEQRIRALK